jgi:hypothetical protein
LHQLSLLTEAKFWDHDPSLGPSDSWTIHGLWPDNCSLPHSLPCHLRLFTNSAQVMAPTNPSATPPAPTPAPALYSPLPARQTSSRISTPTGKRSMATTRRSGNTNGKSTARASQPSRALATLPTLPKKNSSISTTPPSRSSRRAIPTPSSPLPESPRNRVALTPPPPSVLRWLLPTVVGLP